MNEGVSQRVKASGFDGPFDLLLSLVEKRKMHISDISLSAITDDFIKQIESTPIPVAQTAEFILIAATLMLIKSRSLLPGFVVTREENGDIADLERRLRHYQIIKERASDLQILLTADTGLFARRPTQPVTTVVFRPTYAASDLISKMDGALRRILSLLPSREKIPQVMVKKMISLEEVISSLRDRLARAMRTTLAEFAGTERPILITSFLALLELMKQGHAHAHQPEQYAEISIETLSYGVPRYD